MNTLNSLALLIATLLAAPSANAAVDLIAIDGLSSDIGDLSTKTAYPLENGVPGNLLGGMGSGFTYAGGNTYLGVPDRGPNAVQYNPDVSDTASYINRFQTLRMTLEPSAPGAPLPFTLTPQLVATTLLHSARELVYGDGVAFGLPDGAPALNAINDTYYFTGRSDNFDATRVSIYPGNARFDPESIRISNDLRQVFISDEYGPYIYRFDRRTGRRTGSFRLPGGYAVSVLSANGDVEIDDNDRGRVANKGMEALAITPDGGTLVGVMQSPLLQDGGTDGPYTRIIAIDLATGTTRQYAYPLTNSGTDDKPKYLTVSDIVAVNDHEFLVDERDGKGLGDDSLAVYKRLYHIDLATAQRVDNVNGAQALGPLTVDKTLFLDIVAVLNAHGIAASEIPAKLEGVTFGPDVVIDGAIKRTLFVANDNDFLATVTDDLHPEGVDNPNLFLVFAVDPSDLPTYVPQAFSRSR